MGWEDIPWVTITDDFDRDHDVDEWHGTNAFVRDGDQVYRTYFVDARGDEAMGGTWSYLDITAFGRQEEWEDSPDGLPADASVPVVELARRVRARAVIAHVGGLPVEELLTPLVAVGSGVLVAITVPIARLRKMRTRRTGD